MSQNMYFRSCGESYIRNLTSVPNEDVPDRILMWTYRVADTYNNLLLVISVFVLLTLIEPWTYVAELKVL